MELLATRDPPSERCFSRFAKVEAGHRVEWLRSNGRAITTRRASRRLHQSVDNGGVDGNHTHNYKAPLVSFPIAYSPMVKISLGFRRPLLEVVDPQDIRRSVFEHSCRATFKFRRECRPESYRAFHCLRSLGTYGCLFHRLIDEPVQYPLGDFRTIQGLAINL